MRRPGTAANSSSTEPATVALASGSPRRPPSPPSPPPRQRLQHSSGQVTLRPDRSRKIAFRGAEFQRNPSPSPSQGSGAHEAATSLRARCFSTYWANVRVPVEKRTTERRLRPFAWPLWRPLETTPRVSAASPRPLFLNAGSLS